MNPYSYCCDILPACNMSTISFFASLLEHCQCFPREDVFLILALGSVRGNTVPRAVFLRTLPRAQGVYWILWSLWIISSDINPVDSEYQEIHPYSALNIDSVKINTSLLMMREWSLPVKEFHTIPHLCCFSHHPSHQSRSLVGWGEQLSDQSAPWENLLSLNNIKCTFERFIHQSAQCDYYDGDCLHYN